MSWDVSIVIDTGDENNTVIEDVRNLTFNNSKILTYLKVHPSFFNENSSCSEWIPAIKKALSLCYDINHQYELLKLEPPNKWGGLRDVTDFLHALLKCCEKHSKANVKWS